jgi:hypothetical protein
MEFFGGGYDIPTIGTNGGKRAREHYELAFGADPQIWEDASPSLQIQPGKSIPSFLIVHAGERRASKEQALMLAVILEESGLTCSGQAPRQSER